ncbi:flagellar biosynthesis anti-sigma factor FlgM [Hydrogenophaga sp.]|uniref:flagellar biosynthesis anti-sigma factor FlgM n=1 Tax=Hydrogenophaga sp. TaxID=1904254 RepID=UPI003F6B6055
MKVESSPDSYIGSVAGGPQKAAAAPAAGAEAVAAPAPAAAAKPQAGVTVTLSSTSQAMAGGGSSSDVFNAEKVAAMKQAIASGSFQVNPEAIADKMLSNAAEMLSISRS